MKKIMFNDKYGLTDAVLQGRKTVTRRIVKRKDLYENDARILIEPQYSVGEILAIAQRYKDIFELLPEPHFYKDSGMISAWIPESAGYKNKMFVKAKLMPSKLRILDVRVEGLQDITDEDCIKEGIVIGKCGNPTNWAKAYYIPNDNQPYLRPIDAFKVLIDKVSGNGTWERNPYVFRYEFELQPNTTD